VRTILFYLTLFAQSVGYGSYTILVSAFGARAKPGNLLDRIPRIFSRGAISAAGARVVVHNSEKILADQTAIYVSNHVSWFDIFALASVLPHYRFIAKAELRKVPFFGPAAGKIAAIYVDRKNRKAAFDAYRVAAEQVKEGVSVVVCPEGTRGTSYSLRPFKKGPFVLAIAAQVPIVPVVVYGTREVQPKGAYRVKPATIEITVLDQISTAGHTYEERDALMRKVWQPMAAELERRYGVKSEGVAVEPSGEAPGVSDDLGDPAPVAADVARDTPRSG
jgi:1-acyl-sn-glycerol-3-phosphate acyltransferase